MSVELIVPGGSEARVTVSDESAKVLIAQGYEPVAAPAATKKAAPKTASKSE